jgi:hypothetical protein
MRANISPSTFRAIFKRGLVDRDALEEQDRRRVPSPLSLDRPFFPRFFKRASHSFPREALSSWRSPFGADNETSAR